MFKKRLLRASKLIALGMALAMAVIVPGAQASHFGPVTGPSFPLGPVRRSSDS